MIASGRPPGKSRIPVAAPNLNTGVFQMVDIKGSFSDSSYTWAEDRPGGGGGGPRSMKLLGDGLDKGWKWPISPNPHENATYNKNQKGLYEGFVKKINNNWPRKNDVKFTPLKSFDDIPAKEKPKNFTKMKKAEQDRTLKNYNKDKLVELEVAAREKYVSAVIKHLKGKKGSKFTYGGVMYTLG